MELKELRKQSADELGEQLHRACASEQFNLRMQKGAGQLRLSRTNSSRVRREIAQIKTVLGQDKSSTKHKGSGNERTDE